MPRSLFISLDGLDGTGKSTQCRLLAEWLRGRGYDVLTCTDPGGTPIGSAVREIVLHHRGAITLPCEAFLFMASRAQLVAEVICPALVRGRIVICDRFLLANVVYQGHAGGLDVDRLWEIGRLATGGLEPHLTIVLDLPLETALSRRNRAPDRMESKARAYQQRVREGFLTEARQKPERIRVVDAAGSIESVQQHIRKEVERVLAAHPRT